MKFVQSGKEGRKVARRAAPHNHRGVIAFPDWRTPAPVMPRHALLLCSLGLLACGRTELVRYSIEGVDTVPVRSEDGGILCVDGHIPLQPAHPVVMLLVDRSNSMNQSFPGTGTTKWRALTTALHTQLPAWNDAMMLGLTFFPSNNAAACSVSSTPELMPALDAVETLLARLDATSPGGSTPTALAIDAAGGALKSLRSASSAKAVVLATDGAPDCNAELDPSTCICVGGSAQCTAVRCLDDTRTIGRISALAGQNIPTWVIGLRSTSDAVFVDTLNRMADAGGKPREGANHFYSATSQSELVSAFSDIRAQVGACLYLTTSVPDIGGSIELRISGDFVPYDETKQDGWHWVDPGNGELALSGSACARALNLNISQLEVVVACAQP